jgi:hypothetical protein
VTENQRLLMSLIAQPGEEDPSEIHVIWTAMNRMIGHCQETVAKRVGIFVRYEAIRTEAHQTRYHPLQPYMDLKQMQEYARPWKQILVFIARTQITPQEGQPKYHFHRERKQLGRNLLELARQEVRGESPATDHPDGAGKDSDRLDPLCEACLWFCMELLGQIIKKREYESPLICELALLGVTMDGWKNTDDYPPILSAMIKVSRFIVVQAGYERSPRKESEEESNEESEEDREEESEEENDEEDTVGDEIDLKKSTSSNQLKKSTSSNQPKKSISSTTPVYCLEWVTRFINEFMVRGTNSPMQWMLDLRTYGLKIHYNSTSQGHVDWDGDRRNASGQYQFTVPFFGSTMR